MRNHILVPRKFSGTSEKYKIWITHENSSLSRLNECRYMHVEFAFSSSTPVIEGCIKLDSKAPFILGSMVLVEDGKSGTGIPIEVVDGGWRLRRVESTSPT